MSKQSSVQDMTALTLRFAAGEVELISELEGRLDREMARMAKTLFRRYRLSRTVYGEDDAVNDAKSDLCEAARAGKLRSVRTIEDVLKMVHAMVEQRVLDRRRHDAAVRHGGAGLPGTGREGPQNTTRPTPLVTGRDFRRYERALDELCSAAPSPVDLTTAEDVCETLATYLIDPALKTTLKLLLAGDSHPQIARKLGKSLSFVEAQVKRVQRQWRKINPNPTH